MDDKLKARLVLEIQEEETAKVAGFFNTPYGVVSAVLWILEYQQQYGVVLLPVRGHDPVDNEKIRRETEERLHEIVQDLPDYSYTLKMGVNDMDDVLLRFGVFLVDIRKKYS